MEAAVALASTWVNLPSDLNEPSGTITVGDSIPDNNLGTPVTSSYISTVDLNVEHVEITVSITHIYRGDLQIILTSPSGTQSVMADVRAQDNGANYNNYLMMTIRCWDENSLGTWSISVADGAASDTGTFDSWSITIYGTPNVPSPSGTPAPSASNTPAAASASTTPSTGASASETPTSADTSASTTPSNAPTPSNTESPSQTVTRTPVSATRTPSNLATVSPVPDCEGVCASFEVDFDGTDGEFFIETSTGSASGITSTFGRDFVITFIPRETSDFFIQAISSIDTAIIQVIENFAKSTVVLADEPIEVCFAAEVSGNSIGDYCFGNIAGNSWNCISDPYQQSGMYCGHADSTGEFAILDKSLIPSQVPPSYEPYDSFPTAPTFGTSEDPTVNFGFSTIEIEESSSISSLLLHFVGLTILCIAALF